VIVGQHDADGFVLICQFVLLARGPVVHMRCACRSESDMHGRGDGPRDRRELFHTTGGEAMGKKAHMTGDAR
jgi:hypothetical protein